MTSTVLASVIHAGVLPRAKHPYTAWLFPRAGYQITWAKTLGLDPAQGLSTLELSSTVSLP